MLRASSVSMSRPACQTAHPGTRIAGPSRLMIATVNAYAPNFKASVIARQIFSPLDLERTFGLVGGDIFHGQLDLDRFSPRGRCSAMPITAVRCPDFTCAAQAPIRAVASPACRGIMRRARFCGTQGGDDAALRWPRF